MVPRLEPGAVIDGFQLHEMLHRGGMATLWRVTRTDPGKAGRDTSGRDGADLDDSGLDLPLIMKVPLIGWGDEPGAIVGFEAEQMILPRLSGPHVPRFVAGAFSELPYLVMERIEGASLRPLLDRLPRPPEEVARIGSRVAAALHDIHRQHVIHFDVKPSNVMIRPNGEAVLIDFGLARHERLPDLLAEETRLPVGTAAYVSPEQVRGDRSDSRSDIFALGVVLYFLVTGQRPFGNPDTRAGLRARLYRDPVPPRALNQDCPPWLQEAILRCLEVEPQARYRTGAQLAFDLQNPSQMRLTARAGRVRRDRLWQVAPRWLRTARAPAVRRSPSVSRHLAEAPFVMAAVDLSPEFGALAEALRVTVRRILAIEPAARLTCVNVRKTALAAVERPEQSPGGNPYLQRLIELKGWARPLAVDEDRISFHVLEAVDPAAALVAYARRNQVDHIVIGARGSSPLRRYLGSVSSHVVAEAPCSVTVVRIAADEEGTADPAQAADEGG